MWGEFNHFLRLSSDFDGHCGGRMNEGEMAGKGAVVVPLIQMECVAIDPVRFLMLRRELGDAGAALVVQRVFEGLSETMARLEQLRGTAEVEEFARMGRRLSRLAEQVGLARLARVAEDVVALAQDGDITANAAIWARLCRLSGGVLGAATQPQEGRV